MIIKNFLNKLKITKYSYLVLFLCLITGLIKELCSVFILVVFHEFGHYLMSYIFKWNIKSIFIYPFGGIIKYEEIIDKPLIEELLISIAGIINQFIIYILFIILYKKYYISEHFFTIIKNYNYSMILFNMLPIIPLDGSKIINILLNKFLNFRISYNILSFISIIFLILFYIQYKNNYSNIIIISFLIYEIREYIKNKNLVFNKFILEKYLYSNNYKKYKKINNIKQMKRNRKHLIKNYKSYITEKEFLKKRRYTPNMVYNNKMDKIVDMDNNN